MSWMTPQRRCMCVWLSGNRNVSCLTGTINKTARMKSPRNHLNLAWECVKECVLTRVRERWRPKERKGCVLTCILPSVQSIQTDSRTKRDSPFPCREKKWQCEYVIVTSYDTFSLNTSSHFHNTFSDFQPNLGLFCISLRNKLTICCTAISMKKQAAFFQSI